MKRIAILLLVLGCAGCFGSDKPLYQGVTPLQPFQAGPVVSRDKDGKTAHFKLSQQADGSYDLVSTDKGTDLGSGERLRFFSPAGLPPGTLVAEVVNCNKDFKTCDANSGWLYELVRPASGDAAGKTEWRDPDCSATFSKMAGVAVSIDTCKFADRASLEKALRVAAALPWKADGTYELIDSPR